MQSPALAQAPRQPALPLFDRVVAEQTARNAAALLALSTRREDIQRLEFFVAALASRGWRARVEVSTHPMGHESAMCRLHVWLTCATTAERTTVLMWITEQGITLTRSSERDTDSTQSYLLVIDTTEVHLVTKIEARSMVPAPRAA